jgi:AbrB family looped-hinge helix DNA binding protein
MASATITAKGQITIPSRVRVALGVDTGDRLEFVEIEKGQFMIIPATGSIQDLKGMARGRRKKPVPFEEMDRAIANGAARSL